jgi:hypothetical protein
VVTAGEMEDAYKMQSEEVKGKDHLARLNVTYRTETTKHFKSAE